MSNVGAARPLRCHCWDNTGVVHASWWSTGDGASPAHQPTTLPHILNTYCYQLTNLGTVGSNWRSGAPGRLGMPGKWDRNSNRGMDCLQGTGGGHNSSIRDELLHLCIFIPIRNCIKSQKNLTAEITSR